jgi:hypothetical protein
MYILSVKCKTSRDCIKLKTILQNYCERYLHMNGNRTTTRVDIIRCSDRMFKVSCDLFLRQITKIIMIIAHEMYIHVDFFTERREPWK